MRAVKTSAKGQLTIPVDLMRALGLEGGDELMLIQEGGKVVLANPMRVGQEVLDDLAGWDALSEEAFAGVWDHDADEAWTDA